VTFAWKAAVVLAVAVGGLWTATHGVAGVAWRDVVHDLRGLTVGRLLGLAAIWFGGLGIYSLVLSAAMPGLGIRRSLMLNLSGSAVANVLPLGGAAATALNWRMARRWGHSTGAFVAFCVLTNFLDVATKLVLPLVAVAALAAVSAHVPVALWAVAAGCAAALLLILGSQALLRRPSAAADQPGSGRWAALRAHVRESGDRIRGLLARQWPRLLPASAAYVAAQVVLLFFCLRAVGLDAPVTAVLMAAAIERLGTLVPVTPGGTGVAEIGTIAWLVASGLDPVQVVAGVLLYRIFLVAMEIPVGGALLGAWVWLQRSTTGPRVGETGA
jgi:uncharacterized membrane protein YbhN (UPF0104 family)